MNDRMIAAVIVLLIMLLVALPLHEFSHALAAWRLGDGTAKLFGRLRLDPRVHFDPIGGTLLALSMLASQGTMGFGWAKPTPVNPRNLRGGPRGEAIVALAGPAANLVLAVLAAIPLRIVTSLNVQAPYLLLEILFDFVLVNFALLIFNLIPIPPLDGSRVLYALLPPRIAWRWRSVLERYGTIVLLLVVFLPILPGGRTVLGAIFEVLADPLIRFVLAL